MSVCLSVRCPSRSCIVSKRVNILKLFFHRRVATSFYFFPYQTIWQYMPTRTTSCISCAMRSASVFLLAWAHVIRQGSAPCSALRTRTSCLALYCLCCLKARRPSTASTRSSRPCLVETAEFVGNPAAYFAPCVPSTFDSIHSTNRRAI